MRLEEGFNGLQLFAVVKSSSIWRTSRCFGLRGRGVGLKEGLISEIGRRI